MIGLFHNPFFSVRARCCALATIGLLLAAGCAGQGPSSPPKAIDRYVQGALAYEKGDTDTAVLQLSEAVKENPDLTMAHIVLGDIYREKSDYHNAADQYEQAVRLDPYEYKNHYYLGVSYQFLDRLKEAAACYLRALKLEPQHLDSTMNLGLVYLALGQGDNAVELMRHATEINPKSASAWCNLAVALESKGRLGDAERAYRRASELDPDSALILSDLGENLIRQGRGDDAASIMKEVVKRSDSPLARRRYADALLIAKHDDDALREYRLALRQDAKYYPAMNGIGIVLIRKYQAGLTLDEDLRRQALYAWHKSLQIKPEQPDANQWVQKWDQGGKVLP